MIAQLAAATSVAPATPAQPMQGEQGSDAQPEMSFQGSLAQAAQQASGLTGATSTGDRRNGQRSNAGKQIVDDATTVAAMMLPSLPMLSWIQPSSASTPATTEAVSVDAAADAGSNISSVTASVASQPAASASVSMPMTPNAGKMMDAIATAQQAATQAADSGVATTDGIDAELKLPVPVNQDSAAPAADARQAQDAALVAQVKEQLHRALQTSNPDAPSAPVSASTSAVPAMPSLVRPAVEARATVKVSSGSGSVPVVHAAKAEQASLAPATAPAVAAITTSATLPVAAASSASFAAMTRPTLSASAVAGSSKGSPAIAQKNGAAKFDATGDQGIGAASRNAANPAVLGKADRDDAKDASDSHDDADATVAKSFAGQVTPSAMQDTVTPLAGQHAAVVSTPATPATPVAVSATKAAVEGAGKAVDASHISASSAGVDASETAPLNAIQSAQLLQRASHSEMRVGLHSQEFGSITIRTASSGQSLAAQISVEHADLARAVAAHLPEMQSRMGMNHSVELRSSDAGSFAADAGQSGSGSTGGQQQRRDSQPQASAAGNFGQQDSTGSAPALQPTYTSSTVPGARTSPGRLDLQA